MDISPYASIAGLIMFFSWLIFHSWKLILKLTDQISKAHIVSDEFKNYAEELFSAATSVEKRADIYLFVTIRAIEIGSRRTRNLIHQNVIGLLVFLLLIFTVTMNKFIEVDYKSPSMLFTYITGLVGLVSWLLSLWFSWKLGKLEDGWESGVKSAMYSKLEKHESKS